MVISPASHSNILFFLNCLLRELVIMDEKWKRMSDNGNLQGSKNAFLVGSVYVSVQWLLLAWITQSGGWIGSVISASCPEALIVFTLVLGTLEHPSSLHCGVPIRLTQCGWHPSTKIIPLCSATELSFLFPTGNSLSPIWDIFPSKQSSMPALCIKMFDVFPL